MKLSENNIWVVITLLVTTIIGPVIVWHFQQGKIEEEKLQLDKNKQVVEMYEKLSTLLSEQRIHYDEYAALVQSGHTKGSFKLQRKRFQMEEKDEEITNVKTIISKMTGKQFKQIKGKLPPLPPSGLRIVQ